MSTTTIEPLLLSTGPGPAAPGSPSWFQELQISAWAEFEALPFPARKDETWRFSNVKGLALDQYALAPESTAEVSAEVQSRALEGAAGQLIFLNDRLVAIDFFDNALREQGVVFTTLEEALVTQGDLLQAHFMSQPARLGSQKFAALHKAMVKAGTFLHVPKGVEIRRPFQVFHFIQGRNAAVFPHTLVIADPASRVTVVDHFISLDPFTPGFACGVNDLIVKDQAQLTYISVQEWSREFTSVQINSTMAGRDAAATNLSLNLGGKYSRLESVSRLQGAGGRSDMLAVSVARNAQEFDQRTYQDHLRPNTTSDLLYKNALFDEARTIFSGLIKVEPGAHRTDAYQKVRNLLLSDEAEANSLPGLEILADDVRCTHGATSGQVEEEELFYLKSRGIPERAAKALIVRGFLNEVTDRLPDEALRTYLHRQIDRYLG
ncbi:MAG: Fe-S cluster assembly protein SufD [Verrucomicrobia bacterium]|nr:Fe-S cluster assembly protein SufD [Verrucomicrobiota bacterium]